ncbi:MAG: amidohydrolase, partial [Alphaproteobacteria bacterium]|nr:amidohydrolase [Alphaproteobacteria bacterium]
RVVNESPIALQISQAGNIRSAVKVVKLVEAGGYFDRLLISSDTPTGTGMMPLGVIKSLVEMACLTGVEPERINPTATGN